MKRLIITEEERIKILGMHKNAISKEYLMEQKADITKQVEAAYNQILTTLRTIKMVPGTESPITFGNPVKDTSNTDLDRIFYNITINVGGQRPENFTVKVGSMINVSDPGKVLAAWQNYLIGDFTSGINNVQTNSKTWATLKNAILTYLKNVKLTTPTQPK